MSLVMAAASSEWVLLAVAWAGRTRSGVASIGQGAEDVFGGTEYFVDAESSRQQALCHAGIDDDTDGYAKGIETEQRRAWGIGHGGNQAVGLEQQPVGFPHRFGIAAADRKGVGQ